MMMPTNRSRTGSGSSDSSRGSGTGGGKPPRRRSHRPRGCRGGSKRRKNSDELKKQRAAASGGATTGQNSASKNANRHPSSGQDFTILSRNQANGNHNFGTMPSSDHGNHMYMAYPSASFYPPSYHPAGNNHYGGSSYQNQTPLPSYPGIQTSFSDSSGEEIMEASLGSTGKQQPANTIYPSLSEEGILPPLPKPKSNKKDVIPSGPNPYALKHTSRQGTYVPKITTDHKSFGTLFFGGGIFSPLVDENLSPHTCPQPTQSNHPSKRNEVNEGDNSYTAERLEKQRQNVEGGSLFVTSPRSFLMGIKTDVAATAQ